MEDGLKAAFAEIPLAEHLRSIVDSVVTNCVAKAKDNNPQPQNGPAGGFSALSKFNYCFMKEFMNACPKDKQHASQHCVKMREGYVVVKIMYAKKVK